MFKKIFLMACVVSFMVIGLCFAQEQRIEVQGRYWISDLEAEAKVIESGIGDKFDFKDDLGIDDENLPEARIIFHTGPNSLLRLGYTQVNYSGDETVSRTVEFKGQSYTAGARVESELDIKYARFGWLWYFLSLADDKVKLGSIVEAKAVMADISLKAPTLSLSDSEHFIGGLPTAGLACQVKPIEKVKFFGEISGIGAGEFGYFFDAEAGIAFVPLEHLSIEAGYRMIDLKAEDDPDFATVQMRGPFLSVTARF